MEARALVRALGDVVLAVLARQLAVGVDDHRGVEAPAAGRVALVERRDDDDPEPPRHRARARLHALEKELEAILAELENPATSTSPERTR